MPSPSRPPAYWSASELAQRLEALKSTPATGGALGEQWMTFQDTLLRLKDWYLLHATVLVEGGFVTSEQGTLAALLVAIAEESPCD